MNIYAYIYIHAAIENASSFQYVGDFPPFPPVGLVVAHATGDPGTVDSAFGVPGVGPATAATGVAGAGTLPSEAGGFGTSDGVAGDGCCDCASSKCIAGV